MPTTVSGFLRAVLDAVPTSIAVLDGTGAIVSVNEPWRRFAAAHGADPDAVSEGANYLAVCDAAAGPDAGHAHGVAADIRRVIAGDVESIDFEYPCHGPGGQRFFTCHVGRVRAEGFSGAVTVHEDVTAEREADRHARASEEQFHDLFARSPDALLLADATGRIVTANERAERLFGRPQGEIVGLTVEDLMPARFRAGHQSHRAGWAVSTAHRHLGAARSALWVLHKDGREIPVDISLMPIHSGRDVMVAMALRDLTERHNAEQELRQSEEKYRQIIEQSNDIFYRVIGDAALQSADLQVISPNVEALTGYKADEFGKNPGLWVSLLHPDDRAAAMAATLACHERRVPVTRNYRMRVRDGEYRRVEDRIWPVFGADGTVVGRSGVARDVTDRSAAEDRLRESQRALALAQATSHLGDWRILPDGATTWSDEMYRLHNLEPPAPGSADAAAGPGNQRFLDLVHPDDRDRILAVRQMLIEGRSLHSSFVYRTSPASGPVRLIETQARAVTDGAGRMVEWYGTCLDVTERERRSAELRQHQKMQSVGQLAGGIAHDFNNILSEIIGFGGFVRNALDEGDPRRDDIVNVLDAANRAAALTRQLLTFSRQQPAVRRPTDLNQRLDEFGPLLKRTVGEHIDLSIEPAARAAVVLIDPVQFDQVVLNLVTNARDAMPGGGTLRVSLSADASHAYLRVVDTGVGMDEETQQRIFDPFFTTKPIGLGTGLGLATCFGIVGDAGGSIRVESEMGRGSTFLVTLPQTPIDPVEDSMVMAEVSTHAGYQEVLLCEDEEGLRRVGVRVLEEAGYRVHVAANGLEAIQRIDEIGSRLAAIVTDMVMPGCGGDEVATHAARVIPKVPVLMVSGYFDQARVAAARAFTILWKPIAPSDLVRAVSVAIERASS